MEPGFAALNPGYRQSGRPCTMRVMIGTGYADRFLSADETRAIVREGLSSLQLDGKRVLFIIPDGTRTMPMPELFRLFKETLGGKVAALDYLVALGTHRLMSDAELTRLVGHPVVGGKAGDSHVFNHEWADPATFAHVGEIPAAEIAALTGGRLTQTVPVSLNRRIFDYDQIVICGPVFPHEVVGFSGGNKYFFPGIAGAEIINFTHWLGALITNYEVIGAGYTPVRAVIDRAAALVTVPTACLALVVTHAGLAGPVLRVGTRGVAAGVAAVGEAAHRLAGRAGAAGAVGDAADVRRRVDRRQGHVQDRAGGRRRRRSDHLRAAHPRGELYARPPARRDRLSLPRLLRRAARALRQVPRRRARAFDPCEGPRHLRRRDRRRAPARERDARHRHFRRSAAAGSTLAIATRRRSTSPRGPAARTRGFSWCRARAKCSIG